VKENIRQEISVLQRQLSCVYRNIFSRCKACTEAGQHFEIPFLTKAVILHSENGQQIISTLCGKLAITPYRTHTDDKLETLYYSTCEENIPTSMGSPYCSQ
jgi:hypothetical protein